MAIEIWDPPVGLEHEFSQVFSAGAVGFLHDLVLEFAHEADKMLIERELRKSTMDIDQLLPDFKHPPEGKTRENDWKIWPLPDKLRNRHLDLGDVAPSDKDHLRRALIAEVEGIQVDFDDGSCPTWKNTVTGMHNIISIVQGTFLPGLVPSVVDAPILMLRPRAWNMVEHNVFVNGREVLGPLVDFALLIYHIGRTLAEKQVGPFFYLSKLEGANEAKLWNDIFTWSEEKLGLGKGTIKACVLIENILAAFEMDEILYQLREHAIGLNCGIWDYCASFINKFGARKDFLLPDRNKYVNMEKHFLVSYMKLVVQTCHKRGSIATGGMAAGTLTAAKDQEERQRIADNIRKAKSVEIASGVDGFMVYDTDLVPCLKALWEESATGPNQISSVTHDNLLVSAKDLLQIPQGGVTIAGLRKNILVGVLFIHSWLHKGKGHFILQGVVEDSATAEISRSQVWQWIRHQVKLEDSSGEIVTKSLVAEIVQELSDQLVEEATDCEEKKTLRVSSAIFLDVVTSYEFPEFITTYLSNHRMFRDL